MLDPQKKYIAIKNNQILNNFKIIYCKIMNNKNNKIKKKIQDNFNKYNNKRTMMRKIRNRNKNMIQMTKNSYKGHVKVNENERKNEECNYMIIQ